MTVAAAPRCSYPGTQVRRVAVIMLALVVLGPMVARASTWYRCARDGELRAACCCPSAAGHRASPAPAAELRAACCCTITQIAARASSIRGAPPATFALVPAVAVAAVPPPPPREPPLQVAAIGPPQAPRGPPAPLFARHCSLLL
jgi:hypothetical protein